MSGNYYCETEALAVGYGGEALLKNIALGVKRGQILTLIGPNGAGKSTILKTLASQLAPMGGRVLLDGRSLAEYTGNERARKMALMLPHTRRTEMISCFEMAAAGRYPYTGLLGSLSPEDKRQVRAALKLVGAEALAGQDFNKISDGQRQRVLLARAVCQEPEVILLDEPTSFLDIKGKLELLELLKTLAREKNMAVILSLHELELAQKISDIVVCVSPRGVSRAKTPEEAFTAENIRELYSLSAGGYEPLYGSVELPRPEGEADVFVIGGAGRGIPIYRLLQRRGRAFCAGILYENDLDYPVAAALAAKVISCAPFEQMTAEHFEKARAVIDKCSLVVCAEQSAGRFNEQNRALADYAHAAGKAVSPDAL